MIKDNKWPENEFEWSDMDYDNIIKHFSLKDRISRTFHTAILLAENLGGDNYSAPKYDFKLYCIMSAESRGILRSQYLTGYRKSTFKLIMNRY